MSLIKVPSRSKPFHLRYLELCKSKNVLPLPEVKVKNKDFSTLDFFGDRLKIDDWMSVFNALYYDTSLHYVAIKLRKNHSNVLENINSVKKARKFHGPPVILTHVLFTQFVDTIQNLMVNNGNLTTLLLEGLPLKKNYITYIANGLSKNRSIKNLSFARSALGDEGCEIICSNIKCLTNINCLNLSQCQLSPKGAEAIADLIKFQKIVRFTKGWENTLRYRTVDPDILPGLKRITINGNQIKDEGLYFIMEILKEDVWIKVIDVQNCGLSDDGAKVILDCLDYNNTLLMVDIHGNSGISMELVNLIKMQLGPVSEESSSDGSFGESAGETKVTVSQLKEKIKMLESQLQNEQFRQRQMEALNESMRSQLVEAQKQLSTGDALPLPDGFTLIETHHLDQLIADRDHMAEQLQRMSTGKNSTKAKTILRNKRPQIPSNVDKARSEIHQKRVNHNMGGQKMSRSHCHFPTAERPLVTQRKAPFVETNIGDTCENVQDSGELCDEEILKIFMKKRPSPSNSMMNVDGCPDELNSKY